jgi:large subunit ribosomal protein L3
MQGVFKKAGTPVFRVLKEFGMEGRAVGDKLQADLFAKGDVVKVAGLSKGKAFRGVMKRHRFKGGPSGHGSMFNRAPGSIGASSYPSRVWRGQRMAGHMGLSASRQRTLRWWMCFRAESDPRQGSGSGREKYNR